MLQRPAVTPFVECPNCNLLVEYGVRLCSRCREEISLEYGFASALVVHHNTQACSLANTIKTLEPAAVINILSGTFSYLLGAPTLFAVNLFIPILAVAAILLWFLRYGSFKIGDEDYVKAKRVMRISLRLWLALLVVELVAFGYMLRG
jgi:hypothetical protein